MASIYRSEEGRAEIRDFCEDQLAAWPVPHERLTLTTRLGPTHLVRAGTGPEVVVVPGTNFNAASSVRLLGALAEQHTVLAVDLPGQPGLSHDVRPRRSRPGYGAWLAQVVGEVASDPPVLIGHSLGAAVALDAVAAGAPTSGLVLADPAGVMWLSVTARVMRPTIPWLRSPSPTTSAGLLEMMSAPGATPAPDLVAWMTLVGRHVRTSLAPAPRPRRTLEASDHLPAAVLIGEHDVFVPPRRATRSLRRRLPHADVEVVPGAGHLLPEERPEAVAAAVARLTSPTAGT